MNTIFSLSKHLGSMGNGVTKTLSIVHVLQNYNGKALVLP